MKLALILCAVIAQTALAATPTPTPTATPVSSPTPPILKPYKLAWDANAPGDNVKWYSVYRKLGSIYYYWGSVYVPAPPEWVIPPTALAGTIFVVTASDGSLESGYSNEATLPSGPVSPANVKITITFP